MFIMLRALDKEKSEFPTGFEPIMAWSPKHRAGALSTELQRYSSSSMQKAYHICSKWPCSSCHARKHYIFLKIYNFSKATHVNVSLYCQGRFIMSNKVARTIAFFYTLLVHLLIFLVSTGAWKPLRVSPNMLKLENCSRFCTCMDNNMKIDLQRSEL